MGCGTKWRIFIRKKGDTLKDCIQKTYYIDPATGEVINLSNQSVHIQTDKQRKQARRLYLEKQDKKGIEESYRRYGNFIWSIYSVSQAQFPALKPSNITRLMFISTYVGYDGYLVDYEKKPLSKSQIASLLKLSEREFRNFWNDVISNKILIEDSDDEIHLNEDLFLRGKIASKEIARLSQENKFITRLYANGIRSLYRTATIKSHRTLSYIFQVLPFVNREYNIVCHNPLEPNLDFIKPMSLGEFCDIIGYDKSHATRLFNTLFEPQFKVGKKGSMKRAMRYVVDEGLDKKTFKMYINPRVYYAGSHWRDVEILAKF